MGCKLLLLESMKLIKDDTFEFGVWEGKPIEWQVLDVGSRILCISKDCLDNRRFDEEIGDWKKSELRQWLNSDFLNRAFTSEEKSFMLPYEGDKVTLLSIDEVEKYFSSRSKRRAYMRNGKEAWWWLRSPGYNSSNAANVYAIGYINFNGYSVHHASGSVRPVILLKKEVENFLEPEA